MTAIETIRETFEAMRNQFLGYAEHHLAKGDPVKAGTNANFAAKAQLAISDAAALETELATLRANALDLTKLPDLPNGVAWVVASQPAGKFLARVGGPFSAFQAVSNTIASAFDAACDRAKEAK